MNLSHNEGCGLIIYQNQKSKLQIVVMSNDFYLRYYVGHKGKFGHEFLEFEFRPDGKLR